ncbi:DNA cytosine methyltransferase [Xenorhabdus innexi]|uniref:Methyltransferase n=1 Tax=Xenorhabdus innexi TaxID=290109 RepID=A0A1N6N1X9_9GAMM|nr:DNA cytosine methyltransferase [Xenorhabdus innexi]PHM37140.1 methyltransferase [Xenorhabdus innexi]SIP75080.1 Phage methyltransferase [Xenorhabdus innexi]
MSAYYNEIDPYAAQWLRNLITAGHIAPGDVDERSIEDVRPDDLRGYKQCHFFAGIGVWSCALRRAEWPDERPVWTGSCPCQPFSAAGKGSGFTDERHLWPHFHYLIEQCRPDVIFGEQVASRDGLHWLDLVQTDLEGTGYSSAAVDLCAAGIGAPHIRQRLYWVGHANNAVLQGLRGHGRIVYQERRQDSKRHPLSSAVATHIWHEWKPDKGADGKIRVIPPCYGEVAAGAAKRVGRLRAYGNALVAPVAETFIRAYMQGV